MPLLVPRVGKEDVHAGERGRRDHPLQHLDRVMLDDAHVVQLRFADALQQRADAGLVHLDADEVVLRQRGGDRRGRIAHAEADLEHRRRVTAEQCGVVERLVAERQHETRSQFVERATLTRADASGAAHVAADRAARRLAVVGVQGAGDFPAWRVSRIDPRDTRHDCARAE